MHVLVDVLDFVIALFQSGVFEYILFCVRVIVATRLFLVDVLDFVIVLFQSGVFEYILIYSGWRWLVAHICKTYFCTSRKLLRGAKNEVARDVWEFQRSLSRLSSSMVKCIFIPEDKHAKTNLNNYGL